MLELGRMKFFIRDLRQQQPAGFYITAKDADEALSKARRKLKHHDFHIDEAISDGNDFVQVLSRRLYNLLAKDFYSVEMEKTIKKTMKEFALK